jgi:hypothetical protein
VRPDTPRARAATAALLALALLVPAPTAARAQASADVPASFDREAAAAAALQAEARARAGEREAALAAAADAVRAWPVDPSLWEALAQRYAAAGSAEGASYARFFAARLPTLNALHPRAAASAMAAVQAPEGTEDAELRRAYPASGALLQAFYRGRYEDARATREAAELAEVPFYRPLLAYPAAAVGAAVFGSALFRFAAGLGDEANDTRR